MLVFQTPRLLLVLFLVILTVGGLASVPAAEKNSTGDFWSDYEREASQGENAEPAVEPPSLWIQTLKMLGGLAFTLGLLGLGAWFLRRHLARAEGGSRTDFIRVVASKMLGGRKSLLLVRVRGQTLLLGITPQAITFLTEIHEVEGEWAQPSENLGQSSTQPGQPAAQPGRKLSAFDRKLGAYIQEVVSEAPPTRK